MKKQNYQRCPSAVMFESLENREFLSASPTIKSGELITEPSATTTALFVSNRSALLGQTVAIKGVVTSSDGTPKGGTVELLSGDKDTGLTGTLNHLGYFVFTLDAGQSTYVGTHLWRIRYLGNSSFIGSKSRQLIAKTIGPPLTTESDGLELATVTAGSGTAVAASGSTLVVQYTGFNAADGSVFDDSADHSPSTFTFTVDDPANPVITGFDQEATGMKVGETRVAIIPTALAYSSGSLAGQTLVFVLRVLSIS